MKFHIHQQKTLYKIPSASGLVKYKNFFYVLGDDSPFLFKLDSDFEIVERFPIISDEQRERITKREKPDFEALEMISEDEMLCFGSGSLPPQRDKMITIKIGPKTELITYSLSSFYAALRDLPQMQDCELNIEAAAFHEEQLFLFNRRKNVIFRVPFLEFLSFLEERAPLPEISCRVFDLPGINGIEAGFSGATTTSSGRLIVTCSVEDTDNAYDDGEVLGSFVGISSGVKNDISEAFSWTQINSGEALKVESIIVEREISDNEIDLVMVTDSDGADSLIIKGTLKL